MCKNELTWRDMANIFRKVMITTDSGKVIRPNIITDKFSLEQMALVYDLSLPEARADLLKKRVYYKSIEDAYVIKLKNELT